MYQFMRILKRDFINLCINPMWVIGSIFMSFFLALVLGFVTKGSYGSEFSAFDYYGITALIYAGLNNASVAANSFMENRIMKANMRLCNSPINQFLIPLSKIIASFMFGFICHVVLGILLYVIVGVNFGTSILFLLLLLLVIEIFSSTLGILLCCIFKSEEMVNQSLSSIISLLCLLGGTMLPLKGLGKIISTISEFSPVTWLNTACFQLIYDNYSEGIFIVCLGLLFCSAIGLLFISKLFNREDYL